MLFSPRQSVDFWRTGARRLKDTVVNVVFPSTCASCQHIGPLLCKDCLAEVTWVAEPICRQCGRPHSKPYSPCPLCRHNPLPLHQVRSAALFQGPLPGLIHQFKYRGYSALAKPLAGLMKSAWPAWDCSVGLIIPVPLHAARRKERGYNQSALLAKALADSVNQPVNLTALTRTRATRPQVGLGSAERLSNVQGAFTVQKDEVLEKDILLIDDVFTTGATLSAAADCLLAAGARSVSAFCLAQAVGNHDTSRR